MSFEPSAIPSIESDFDWGEPEWFGTAAYWADQTRRRKPAQSYSLGATLAEEVAACLLGGYGVPAEVGLAAFKRVRDAGLLAPDCDPTPDAIETLLMEPMTLGERCLRYRFASQRSLRVATALRQLRCLPLWQSAIDLRNALLQLPGVGPKTASWIVRNQLGSSDVAIIDIHVERAGKAAGFLNSHWTLPKDYFLLERDFIAFAELAGVHAAELDACIWEQTRELGRYRDRILHSVSTDRLRRQHSAADRH